MVEFDDLGIADPASDPKAGDVDLASRQDVGKRPHKKPLARRNQRLNGTALMDYDKIVDVWRTSVEAAACPLSDDWTAWIPQLH